MGRKVLPPSQSVCMLPIQALMVDGLCTRTPKSEGKHWSTTVEFFGQEAVWPVVTAVYPVPLSMCTSILPSSQVPPPVVNRNSVPAHGGGVAGGIGSSGDEAGGSGGGIVGDGGAEGGGGQQWTPGYPAPLAKQLHSHQWFRHHTSLAGALPQRFR